MSKNDTVFEYEKDGKPFIVVNKINVSGNSVWQKEIPKDIDTVGSGAHIVLSSDDQFHYDIYHNDGSKEMKYIDVIMLGSTAIPSGNTVFHKSPEQEFHVMPIRGSPKIIKTEDVGSAFNINVDKEGKIFYVLTKKEEPNSENRD